MDIENRLRELSNLIAGKLFIDNVELEDFIKDISYFVLLDINQNISKGIFLKKEENEYLLKIFSGMADGINKFFKGHMQLYSYIITGMLHSLPIKKMHRFLKNNPHIFKICIESIEMSAMKDVISKKDRSKLIYLFDELEDNSIRINFNRPNSPFLFDFFDQPMKEKILNKVNADDLSEAFTYFFKEIFEYNSYTNIEERHKSRISISLYSLFKMRGSLFSIEKSTSIYYDYDFVINPFYNTTEKKLINILKTTLKLIERLNKDHKIRIVYPTIEQMKNCAKMSNTKNRITITSSEFVNNIFVEKKIIKDEQHFFTLLNKANKKLNKKTIESNKIFKKLKFCKDFYILPAKKETNDNRLQSFHENLLETDSYTLNYYYMLKRKDLTLKMLLNLKKFLNENPQIDFRQGQLSEDWIELFKINNMY